MDSRKERSRAAIRAAFLDLLAEKDYGKITVDAILARAGVGRATFYAQFKGKDDLVVDFVTRTCAETPGHGKADGQPLCATILAQVNQTLGGFLDCRTAVRMLVSGGGSRVFTDSLRHTTVARATAYVPEHPDGPAGQMDRSFLLHHIAAAFVGAVQWWAWHDFEAAPEELAADFLRAIEPLFAPERNTQQARLPESNRRAISCTSPHVHDGL